MKTTKIVLDSLKEPDKFQELCVDLGLIQYNEIWAGDPKVSPLVDKFFDCGEYASIEIEVDENLNIVGGRFLPVR